MEWWQAALFVFIVFGWGCLLYQAFHKEDQPKQHKMKGWQ